MSDSFHPRKSGYCYELRFINLFNAGRGYAFPCDSDGHVNLDLLSERARLNYFYARVMIGHEVYAPVAQVVSCADGSAVS